MKLCEAIRDAKTLEFKRIIDSGVDLDQVSADGATVLFFAYHFDRDFTAFDSLLKAGAIPNTKIPCMSQNGTYASPLRTLYAGDSISHLVAKSNYNRLFKSVFSHGGDPNAVWHISDFDIAATPTTLISTSAIDATERLEFLLTVGADPLQLSSSGMDLASSKVADGIRRSVECFDRGCSMAILLCEEGNDFKREVAIKRNVIAPHPYEGASFRLIHWVALGAKEYGEEATKLDSYQALVGWLEKNGESFAEAKLDLLQWNIDRTED